MNNTPKFVRLSLALDVPRQRSPRRGLKTKIYALVDPRDAGVRYVGKTRKPPLARLEGHLREPTNGAMAKWFGALAAVGLQPHIEVLEHVADAEWEDAERGWIHWFRQRGDLLNVDPGGDHRDRRGRERGIFEGRFAEPKAATRVTPPAPSAQGGIRNLWERTQRPMRPAFTGQDTRKDQVAGQRASAVRTRGTQA